jgi:hypothetical protein
MEAFNYRDINHRIADSFFLDSLVQIRMVSLAFSKAMPKEKNAQDFIWIILAWLVAGAMAFIFFVKVKILLH